jgi:nucleoside-diphosphate-sugar epimerase
VSRILVTGASGFVGRALVNELAAAGQSVRAAMRQPADIFPRSVEVVAVSDLTRPVEWRALLRDVATVVHLAGIAHASRELAETAYDRVNRLATAELAAAARAAGIRRLVFVSSIRAQSGPAASQALRETDQPHPTDAYGRSKLAAEEAVRAANVPYTILRPVLVYGADARGNLARLLEVARSPWPLPFMMFRQRRSLLARQNLIGAIRFALDTPGALGQTYIVADPSPLTLGEIVAAMRAGEERPPGLFPVPPPLIGLTLKAMGRGEEWERLGGSLVADPEKLLLAGWQPSIETRAGLAAMARSGREQVA